jgi:hypothetical protein
MRHMQFSFWRAGSSGLALVALVALLSVGCAGGTLPAAATNQETNASTPGLSSATASVRKLVPSPVPGVEPASVELAEASFIPERRNHTAYPTLMAVGQDQWGEYFSVGLKLTYVFNQRGELQIDTVDAEETLDETDHPAQDSICTAKGGGFNQRTLWFPDTGFFVRGGTFKSVTQPDGKPMRLLSMVKADLNYLMVPAGGPDSRTPEMAYAPCVGEYRVARGHRTVGYVPLGSTLHIRDSNGGKHSLTLPTRPLPHLRLRFQMGARVLVPMRVVVASVDVQRKRLVLQFQSTVPIRPPIRVIEWLALPLASQPEPDETVEQFDRRADAVARELDRCPVPKRPFEACASPRRLVAPQQ